MIQRKLAEALASNTTLTWPWALGAAFLTFILASLFHAHVLLVLALCALAGGATAFLLIYAKQRKLQSLDVETLSAAVADIGLRQAERQRQKRPIYVALAVIVFITLMFLFSTNPRSDSFRSFASAKGYFLPAIEQRNFVLFSIFSIRGISGESHTYVGALNQFFELR
jgi:hypothetical protein